ncbi:hypothetical protein HY450_00960 [Candidatus Pacearchaeota archaeon]|nr:hypothetical protein [Candidatus Pacearchaeota archaeon]
METETIKAKVLRSKQELRDLRVGELVILPVMSIVEVPTVYEGVIGRDWAFMKQKKTDPKTIYSYRIPCRAREVPESAMLAAMLTFVNTKLVEYTTSDKHYQDKKRILEEKGLWRVVQ